VAVNLRLAIAAVSPLLPQIQRSVHISSTRAGLLTTIPVACFGAFAFAVPALRRRLGADRLVLLLLALLATGILVRLDPGWWALLAGTVLVGAAIAVGNVVLPVLIRRDFPRRLPLLTGLYSMALAGSAALSAGIVVPLEHALGSGWAPAVALSGAPVILAGPLWVLTAAPPQDPPTPGLPVGTSFPAHPSLWRSRVAWSVTGFMGLQSLGFYSLLAWAPTLLEDHGMAATEAGGLLSLSSLVSIAAATLAPHLARRARRATVAATIVLCALAYLGLAVDPVPGAATWMLAAGIGQGAALSLALGGIVERSPHPAQTTALSTMAQGIGYLLAALGPLLLGALHQASGGWSVPMATLAALTVPELAAGMLVVAGTAPA
jgi:CP family cyanate transporter-like MFS transporter